MIITKLPLAALVFTLYPVLASYYGGGLNDLRSGSNWIESFTTILIIIIIIPF
jgi:hypothetical protein